MQPGRREINDNPVESPHNHYDADPGRVIRGIQRRDTRLARTEQRERRGKHQTYNQPDPAGAD